MTCGVHEANNELQSTWRTILWICIVSKQEGHLFAYLTDGFAGLIIEISMPDVGRAFF